MKKNNKVFISYAKEDYEVAKNIYDDLKTAGLDPWIDRVYLHGGQNWEIEIKKAIKHSNFFLTLFSSKSIAKIGFVQKEQVIAFEEADRLPSEDIFIIPVRLDECEIPLRIEERKIHYIDIFNNYNDGVDEILRSIRLKIEKTASVEIDSDKEYYIGIDLGRYKIDGCIMEYKKMENRVHAEQVEPSEGAKDFERRGEFITEDPDQIRNEISITLNNLFQRFKKKEYKGTIKGIGFGLPGQIDPDECKLLDSPGFSPLRNFDYYKMKIDPSFISKGQSFLVAGDNDVRCAARCLCKEKHLTDAVCIFCGSGLGSGVIINNNLYYGSSFTAGEIGHTSISGCFDKVPSRGKHNGAYMRCFYDILGKAQERECGCKKEGQRGGKGYHFETVASSNGIIKIAKKLDLQEYNLLLESMKEDRYKYKYRKLLQDNKNFRDYEKFIDEYLLKIREKKIEDKLSTHILSLAYYDGEPYAKRVVKIFNEYLAIGIANCINTLNPSVVYLDGGMIRGFYKTLLPKGSNIYTHTELEEKIRDYCPTAIQRALQRDFIQRVDFNENAIAPKGAAMIFLDETYLRFLKSKEYKTVKCDDNGNLS